MRSHFTFVFLLVFLGFSFSQVTPEYKYSLDLTAAKNDAIDVKLIPPSLSEPEATFMFPAIIPGTYAVYDFGRFIKDFRITGKDGKEISFEQPDVNSYLIKNPANIDYITYTVEDTWDTKIKKDFVFEPGGTNIQANKNFVLNNHGFFGYFKDKLNLNFRLEITKPEGFYASTGLTDIKSEKNKDIINVFDYHDLVDSPIMYCKPDTTFINVGGAKVLVSVYSPNKKVSAAFIAQNIDSVLNAQKEYLGGTLPVEKYAFLIYLTDSITGSGATGALEHSYSSFYVLMEADPQQMAQTMKDVAAHEFFHIVTPLNIHSEEIGFFDFNKPVMSEHLWLYEGLTEYAAHHVQVKYGLIDIDDFFVVMQGKMEEAQKYYNDTLPFTYMSKNVLDPIYHEQYQNVYAKGALIGMCLDIILRYNSNGKYGTQEMMRDLAKKYGKDKSFKDPDLFSEIEKLTYPEVRKFLDTYVAGDKKLPFEEVFDKVGLTYTYKEQRKVLNIGGIALGINPKTEAIVVADIADMDDFGKALGYREGDEIVTFAGKKLTLDNVQSVLQDFVTQVKEGEKVTVVVKRVNAKGKEKKVKLKAKQRYVMANYYNNITINKSAGSKQIIARNTWLGITGR
ncbi:MAG: peptidase domain protein [Bacteroidetes bacterium]|jgi:predicted metalloprotease with PDZ domain|nr:peptidase domain protein [Bacteroidota bacterium]